MKLNPRGPVAILSPHLDDAALSAWSVLSRSRAVAVVNVCTGSPGPGTLGPWDKLTGATDSAVRMAERVAEDTEALALAGRTPVNLGFLDNQYRDGAALGGRELAAALEAALPEVAGLVAPAGIGAHADHVAVREAALGLARRIGAPVELYAELPYAVRFGWPSWVTGEPEEPYLRPDARWSEHLASASCEPDRLTPLVECLPDEEATRKLKALEAYRTQFTALDAGPHARLRTTGMLRFEVRWRVSHE